MTLNWKVSQTLQQTRSEGTQKTLMPVRNGNEVATTPESFNKSTDGFSDLSQLVKVVLIHHVQGEFGFRF